MRSLIRKFAKNELGSEMAEFALALAVFSLAALAGWGLIAAAASTRENTMQSNMSTTALNPP